LSGYNFPDGAIFKGRSAWRREAVTVRKYIAEAARLGPLLWGSAVPLKKQDHCANRRIFIPQWLHQTEFLPGTFISPQYIMTQGATVIDVAEGVFGCSGEYFCESSFTVSAVKT
jgi:hypothetical protein